MDARGYLNTVREMDRAIKRKQERIDELRSLVTCIVVSGNGDRVQTSGDKDKIGSITAKIIDMENEIRVEKECYVKYVDVAKNRIFMLSNYKYQSVLYDHYILFRSFDTIAYSENKSLDSIKGRNKRALKEFSKLCLTDTFDV